MNWANNAWETGTGGASSIGDTGATVGKVTALIGLAVVVICIILLATGDGDSATEWVGLVIGVLALIGGGFLYHKSTNVTEIVDSVGLAGDMYASAALSQPQYTPYEPQQPQYEQPQQQQPQPQYTPYEPQQQQYEQPQYAPPSPLMEQQQPVSGVQTQSPLSSSFAELPSQSSLGEVSEPELSPATEVSDVFGQPSEQDNGPPTLLRVPADPSSGQRRVPSETAGGSSIAGGLFV